MVGLFIDLYYNITILFMVDLDVLLSIWNGFENLGEARIGLIVNTMHSNFVADSFFISQFL